MAKKARTVKEVLNLYYQFLHEHGVTPSTAYANVLVKWPEYLKTH